MVSSQQPVFSKTEIGLCQGRKTGEGDGDGDGKDGRKDKDDKDKDNGKDNDGCCGYETASWLSVTWKGRTTSNSLPFPTTLLTSIRP